MTLASCGSLDDRDISPRIPASAGIETSAVSDTPVRIGAPYKVGNTTYTPEDVAAYDEVGYASWYGSEFEGQQTANGEIFTATAYTGAHKTLPIPSYVEVTALETGRTILVRLNDRGPFANDRLIDLSEAAARQLGIIEQGVAGVRVRKVNPPEQERAVLRNGRQAIQRVDTPESLTSILQGRLDKLPRPNVPQRRAAAPQSDAAIAANNGDGRFITEGQSNSAQNTPTVNNRDGRFVSEGRGERRSAPAAVSGFVVQLSSFSSRDRAVALARKVGANVATSSDGNLFRVRYGPFSTEAEAQQGLANARQRGYPQARIFRE